MGDNHSIVSYCESRSLSFTRAMAMLFSLFTILLFPEDAFLEELLEVLEVFCLRPSTIPGSRTMNTITRNRPKCLSLFRIFSIYKSSLCSGV